MVGIIEANIEKHPCKTYFVNRMVHLLTQEEQLEKDAKKQRREEEGSNLSGTKILESELTISRKKRIGSDSI